MTTFEIFVLIALAIIVGCAVITVCTVIEGFRGVWQNQSYNYNELRKIVVSTSETLSDISQQLDNIEDNNDRDFKNLTDILDKMHRNLCAEIADKMVNKMYPVNEGESLDAPFELDYKLKKDIENKLNGFAAAVLDAECCPQEILDLWTERICESAHKFIKQFKIDWDKLSKEQQDEFLKRLIMPNYDKPFQPIYTPCYVPNGICTNPCMDCINYTKRGTGGTWSTNTSIKAKDAPLQERFNDNKEE